MRSAVNNKQKLPRGVFVRPKHRYPLVLLRKATDRSQKEVAKIAEMTQGEVCRIEQKRDARISALSRYAHGLGGRVHIYVELRTRVRDRSGIRRGGPGGTSAASSAKSRAIWLMTFVVVQEDGVWGITCPFLPGVFRSASEHIIVCSRGKVQRPEDWPALPTWVPEGEVEGAPRPAGKTPHSIKPDVFYERAAATIPGGRYLELFARRLRSGWSVWGGEVAPSAWCDAYMAACAELGR